VAFACHLIALAVHSTVATLAVHSTVASDVIEFILLVLAVVACWQAASRAYGYARRFWRLMGVAFGLYAVGQVLATYYDSVLHASLLEWWPSDVFFLYHAAPMVIALFLADDSADSRVYRWQHWLDFLQIGIVSFSAYLFFLYLPMRTVQRAPDLNSLYWWVFTWRNFIVALTFVLRAVFTQSRLVKSLFGRMAISWCCSACVIRFSCICKPGKACNSEPGTSCCGPSPGYSSFGWRRAGLRRSRLIPR